jgi:hypothetical protein
MRNQKTEDCINGIYTILTKELNFLVDSNIGENQQFFQRMREEFVKLQQLTFMYIAEVDSVPGVVKLPPIPPKGGNNFGAN